MKHSNLSPELKEEINKAFTDMIKEVFKPLLEKDVYFGKLNVSVPRKGATVLALSKKYKLPPPLIRSVVQGNNVFYDCKDKLIAKRNVFFASEYKKGSSIDELSQRSGLSIISIHKILKLKQKRRRHTTSSFARVLDESFFSHKPEPADKIIPKAPKQRPATKYTSNSFMKTLNLMALDKSANRKGHNDYLKTRRKKLNTSQELNKKK